MRASEHSPSLRGGEYSSQRKLPIFQTESFPPSRQYCAPSGDELRLDSACTARLREPQLLVIRLIYGLQSCYVHKAMLDRGMTLGQWLLLASFGVAVYLCLRMIQPFMIP